jgi:hypothetical protein
MKHQESIYDILRTFNIEKNKITQEEWINLLNNLEGQIGFRRSK